jgi:hypothetical protein
MAVRGVEDMMASIRANPLVPPVIKSINEFRAAPTKADIKKKEDADLAALVKAVESEVSKEIDNSENY